MGSTRILALDDLKSRCSGKTRTMIRVLDSFVGTSASLQSKLESPEVSSDLEVMGKTLHTIKGLLREISAMDAAKFLEDIETKLNAEHALSSDDLTSVQSCLASACQAAEEAKEELKQTTD